jgi:cytochrome c oxidase assembly factor CtaG
MRFDLKAPIGWMFTVYGGLLVLYGALGDPAQYSRSLGINVNMAWGVVLLTFGILMLIIGRPRK